MTTTTATPAASVAELADTLTDLEGFRHLPGIGQLLDGARDIITAALAGQLTTDDTQSALAVIAGDGPNITSLLAGLVAILGNPDTNPALADLPQDRQDTTRDLTNQYSAYDGAFTPRDLVSEACAAIQGI